MGYRDKKNPWHAIFEEFNIRYPELALFIVATHPVIHPVVQIDFRNGSKALYNGKTHIYQMIDENNYDRVLFDMLVPKD